MDFLGSSGSRLASSIDDPNVDEFLRTKLRLERKVGSVVFFTYLFPLSGFISDTKLWPEEDKESEAPLYLFLDLWISFCGSMDLFVSGSL